MLFGLSPRGFVLVVVVVLVIDLETKSSKGIDDNDENQAVDLVALAWQAW